MKKENVSSVLSHIDEKYINEAIEEQNRVKKVTRRRVIVLLTILVLTFCIFATFAISYITKPISDVSENAGSENGNLPDANASANHNMDSINGNNQSDPGAWFSKDESEDAGPSGDVAVDNSQNHSEAPVEMSEDGVSRDEETSKDQHGDPSADGSGDNSDNPTLNEVSDEPDESDDVSGSNSSLPDVTDLEQEENTSPVSPISFMEFNSFDELEKALNSHTEDVLLSYFIDCGVGNEQVETIRAMVKAIQLHNNIVPYIDGKRIELRSEEGFSNITMYSSEKYGLPCIFYHPTVSNGENLYITLICIPSDLLRNQELSTASDLVKIMSPGYPNIDNFGKQCKAVYNKKVRLRDRDVTAMIYEYNADKRDSTIFLYENLLVEVRNDPEIWGTDWFSTLSFGGF